MWDLATEHHAEFHKDWDSMKREVDKEHIVLTGFSSASSLMFTLDERSEEMLGSRFAKWRPLADYRTGIAAHISM